MQSFDSLPAFSFVTFIESFSPMSLYFVTCVLAFLLIAPILSDTVAIELGEKIIGYVFVDLTSVHVNQESFCAYKAHESA